MFEIAGANAVPMKGSLQSRRPLLLTGVLNFFIEDVPDLCMWVYGYDRWQAINEQLQALPVDHIVIVL